MQCPDCYGKGQLYKGKEWQQGISGIYEQKVYEDCPRCESTGELPDNDRDVLLERISFLEQTLENKSALIEALETKIDNIVDRIDRIGSRS